MIKIFQRTINSIIISSILACIVGIIMITFPGISIETIGIIAASYIIVHGVALIYLDFSSSNYFVPFDGLFVGVLSIIMGTVLIFRPGIVSLIFTIVIGVWMILSSINLVKIAMKLCKTQAPWISILILGILELIAGVVTVFNPFEATLSITLFAGIMLIVHSIINKVDMILIKKDVKDSTKTLEK